MTRPTSDVPEQPSAEAGAGQSVATAPARPDDAIVVEAAPVLAAAPGESAAGASRAARDSAGPTDPTSPTNNAANPAGSHGSAGPDHGAPRSTGRRWGRWLALFVGFWLLTTAWALATPLFGSPDEPSHVFRAAAVARGELLPPNTDEATGGYGVLQVPTSFQEIASSVDCYAFQADKTADCVPDVPDDPSLVEAGSGAAKYNPVYYAITGWPSLLWTDEVGLFAMRIVSAAICSAFLASAVCSAIGGRRGRLATVGVLVAASPMVLFLGGVVNPNSVEIAAAISLWVAGLRLVTGTGGTSAADRVETDALWRRAAIAGSLMALTRGLSPLWLAIIVGICLLVAHKDALLPQLRRARVWMWITLVVASTLASAGWTVFSGASAIPRTAPGDASFLGAVGAALGAFDGRMLQYVGVFGWTDTPAPALTVIVWAALVGVLVVLATVAARRRDAIALVALIAVTLALPLVLEAMQYNALGLFWQSRYTVPIAAGIPILAAIALEGRGGTSVLSTRRFTVLAVLSMAGAHALAFVHTLIRYQVGLGNGYNPLDGEWHPPAGSLTVLGLAAGGLILLAAAVLVLTSTDTAEVPPADGSGSPTDRGAGAADSTVDGAATRGRASGANAAAPTRPNKPVAASATPAERAQRLDPLPAYTERERGSTGPT